MYTRDKNRPTNFFKPLNKREKDRLMMLWKRCKWLEKKAEERDKEFKSSSNFYRQEYSAILWAHDYILAHNKKIEEEMGNLLLVK